MMQQCSMLKEDDTQCPNTGELVHFDERFGPWQGKCAYLCTPHYRMLCHLSEIAQADPALARALIDPPVPWEKRVAQEYER